MKKQLTTIISIILIILVAIFALANTAPVEVNLLVAKLHSPLIILILVCLLIGALIIYLFSLSTHLKQDKELKTLRQSKVHPQQLTKLERQNKELLKENAALKEANARLAKSARQGNNANVKTTNPNQ